MSVLCCATLRAGAAVHLESLQEEKRRRERVRIERENLVCWAVSAAGLRPFDCDWPSTYGAGVAYLMLVIPGVVEPYHVPQERV